MATLTTPQHESIREMGELSRYVIEHWWKYQSIKRQWASQGGLLEKIEQKDLDEAGFSGINVEELKDVTYWFINTVLSSLDDAQGEKLNAIGEATR